MAAPRTGLRRPDAGIDQEGERGPGTIAISSSYGTEGALIGQEVAHRLGIAFFDRAIPVSVARELAIRSDVAMEMDWHAPGRMERFLNALARSSLVWIGPDPEAAIYSEPELFRETTEAVLRQVADGEGGVVMGRGSAVVLGGRPDVLRVRIDGPAEARISQVARRRGVPESVVRPEQRETDQAREAYLQLFYGVSQYDARLYQLLLDRTLIPRDLCVETILRAAACSLGLQAT